MGPVSRRKRGMRGWMDEGGVEKWRGEEEGGHASMVCQQNAADGAVGSTMRREEMWSLA